MTPPPTHFWQQQKPSCPFITLIKFPIRQLSPWDQQIMVQHVVHGKNKYLPIYSQL